MKKILVLLIILLVSVLNAEWEYQDTGVNDNLYGTYFLDNNTGFSVGWGASSGGLALNTTNSGNDWDSTILSNGAYVFSVTFTDENHGYAAGCLNGGQAGAVFKTSNGGSNWTYSSFNSTYGMYDVEFATSDIGYTCGWLGKIYKTTNGGNNWSAITSGTSNVLRWMSVVDEQTIFIAGGSNWDNPNRLYKSTNGTSFSSVYSFSGIVIGGIYFFNADEGIAVGGNNGEIVLKTYDGGTTWEEKYSTETGIFQAVTFAENGVGYACGNNGRVIATSDFGENWSAMESTQPSSTLLAIHATAETVFAVGTNGAFFKHSAFTELDADFSADITSGVAPLSVHFSDESSGSPILWWWDFDNDGTTDSFDQHPQFTFTEAGEYTVSLKISDLNNENIETKIDFISVSSTNNETDVQVVNNQLKNFPNPFNPTTTISFSISEQDAEKAIIEIYNIQGQLIRELQISENTANTNKISIIWNGKNNRDQVVSSGVYFYKLLVEGNLVSSNKMILMK